MQELVQALSELLPSDNNPGWAAEALTALGRSHNYSNLRGAAPFEEMPSITQAGLSSNRSSAVVLKASCFKEMAQQQMRHQAAAHASMPGSSWQRRW